MELTLDGYLVGRFFGKKYVIEINPSDEELVHIFQKRERETILQGSIVYPLCAKEYLPRFGTRQGVDTVARELIRIGREEELKNEFAEFPSWYTPEQASAEEHALDEAIRTLEREAEEKRYAQLTLWKYLK